MLAMRYSKTVEQSSYLAVSTMKTGDAEGHGSHYKVDSSIESGTKKHRTVGSVANGDKFVTSLTYGVVNLKRAYGHKNGVPYLQQCHSPRQGMRRTVQIRTATNSSKPSRDSLTLHSPSPSNTKKASRGAGTIHSLDATRRPPATTSGRRRKGPSIIGLRPDSVNDSVVVASTRAGTAIHPHQQPLFMGRRLTRDVNTRAGSWGFAG